MEPMKITNFELYDIVLNGDQEEINSLETLELQGWVKTNRDNGSIGFVEFNDGINILIGHNNAGKTNLLKALQLVIEPHYRYRKLNAYDFCRDVTLDELKAHSPSVTITLTIKNSEKDYNEQEEDLRVIANWFTQMEDGYEAKLTYRFYLPAEKEEEYVAAMGGVEELKAAWSIIENDFLRYYIYRPLG